MFPEWTWIVGFFIGAAIGSFLNVVIYRMPRGKSLYQPSHSICPKCGAQLSIADLVPLFSWLLLKGRCRYCDVKIPARYFFVEVITGIIWGGLWFVYLCQGQDVLRFSIYVLAASALVAIIYIDCELYLIPEQINGFLSLLGMVYGFMLMGLNRQEAWTWGMPSWLAGWITGVAVLWGIAFLGRILFRKDAMGHGDIKMARGIGAILFPTLAMFSFAMAVALGAVLGIAHAIYTNRRYKNQVASPESEAEEENWEPESLGSLLKSGLGYLLGIDIWGQFYVPLYEKWFGENPFAVPEDLETFDAGPTMIPFGPYLALGAILAAMFSAPLLEAWQNYLNSFGGAGLAGNIFGGPPV